MRTLLLALLLATAAAAPPALRSHTEAGVNVDVPADWKVLVDGEVHNVTMSAGLATSVTMYWYPYRRGATNDVLLDVLMKTVRQKLPLGEAQELSREGVPGHEAHLPVRAGRMHAEVKALGYAMKLGLVTLIDEPNDRMVAAFLVAPPDAYEEIRGLDLLTDVVTSFRLDTDGPLPRPGWWWGAEPPPALVPGPVGVAQK